MTLEGYIRQMRNEAFEETVRVMMDHLFLDRAAQISEGEDAETVDRFIADAAMDAKEKYENLSKDEIIAIMTQNLAKEKEKLGM